MSIIAKVKNKTESLQSVLCPPLAQHYIQFKRQVAHPLRDPELPVHANGGAPWTCSFSSYNLSAQHSDYVYFRHCCSLPLSLCCCLPHSLPVSLTIFSQTHMYVDVWAQVHLSTHIHTSTHTHPHTQQEWGPQLLGVLRVGFTPMLSLTALLLFKCGRAISSKH